MAKDKKKRPGSYACNRWYCEIRKGSYCCKECEDRNICNEECLNTPDKCGQYRNEQEVGSNE